MEFLGVQNEIFDRPPSYPELPSPFLNESSQATDPITPPPLYDDWYKDGVFEKAFNSKSAADSDSWQQLKWNKTYSGNQLD